jgi:hypothetical protein
LVRDYFTAVCFRYFSSPAIHQTPGGEMNGNLLAMPVKISNHALFLLPTHK